MKALSEGGHPDPVLDHFFEAGGAARRCIEETLCNAETIRIAIAYFEASGYQVMQEILAGKRKSE